MGRAFFVVGTVSISRELASRWWVGAAAMSFQLVPSSFHRPPGKLQVGFSENDSQ